MSILTQIFQTTRYELIHMWTTPLKPYEVVSRRNRIWWSTVSNTADKSSSVSIDRSPLLSICPSGLSGPPSLLSVGPDLSGLEVQQQLVNTDVMGAGMCI